MTNLSNINPIMAGALAPFVAPQRLFRIHCSQWHHIMGRMGLTEAQEAKLNELETRKYDLMAKPLTDNMKKELLSLQTALSKSQTCDGLPTGAQTFLKEWYANDYEEIYSKYTQKGNEVEADNIDFMARVLGYGLATKNTVTYSDEVCVGTPDVADLHDAVADVKSPWNKTTFHQNIYGIDPEHEYQLRGYMRLLNREKGILWYGLMDTPPYYDNEEVIYSDLPDSERWIAYQVKRDLTIEQAMIDRVILCRKWLEGYHLEVTGRLGKLHTS